MNIITDVIALLATPRRRVAGSDDRRPHLSSRAAGATAGAPAHPGCPCSGRRRGRRAARSASGWRCLVVVAVVGPFVAPHSPNEFVTMTFAPPSGAAPAGRRRARPRRALAGARRRLDAAARWRPPRPPSASSSAPRPGSRPPTCAGKADGMIMRTVDVLLAFPQLVFALLLLSMIGPKLWLIIARRRPRRTRRRWRACCGRRRSTSPSATTSRRSSCRACGRSR